MEKKKITVGIQGGIGSFNEKAVKLCLKKASIKNYKMVYLYTTRKVLLNLSEKRIDLGFFAIYNNLGGLVEESIKEIPGYKFQVMESVTIPIKHALMKRGDIKREEIKKIMAHPQVLLQCKNNLVRKYSNLIQLSGDGNLLDTAKAAEALIDGSIPKNTAILGNYDLSKIYNLEVIENNLQDNDKNFSTFLLVRL